MEGRAVYHEKTMAPGRAMTSKRTRKTGRAMAGGETLSFGRALKVGKSPLENCDTFSMWPQSENVLKLYELSQGYP